MTHTPVVVPVDAALQRCLCSIPRVQPHQKVLQHCLAARVHRLCVDDLVWDSRVCSQHRMQQWVSYTSTNTRALATPVCTYLCGRLEQRPPPE